MLNPLMPNGISYHHQLDGSISKLKVVSKFLFNSNFKVHSVRKKNTKRDQTQRYDLDLHCLLTFHINRSLKPVYALHPKNKTSADGT